MTVFNFYFDWLHISLVVVIILLPILGLVMLRLISKSVVEELDRHKRNQAADQFDMLHAYAGDTANELILRDEKLFSKNFLELCDEWKEIETKPLDDKRKLVAGIAIEYPFYNDFNLNTTKPHVLAADGFSWESDEDLWKHYKNIRVFMGLNGDADSSWKKGFGIFPDELEQVTEYCNSVTDTKILAHLHMAKDYYDLFRLTKDYDESDTGTFENHQYLIKPTHSIAGIACGVYVKEMDIYGKWDTFSDEKYFIKYSKSDATFELEEPLNALICRFGLFRELYTIKSFSYD